MEKIRSGQSFLYRTDGYDSTVVEIQMKDKVTGSYLQAALTSAAKRFPYMTDKLVEKNGDYYLCPNYNSMVVNKISQYRTLGSMSTGYHLLDVTYTGNCIRVAFHHGLCDGRGVKPLIETLLYYYCCRKYHKTFSSEGIHLAEEAVDSAETAEPFHTEYYEVGEAAASMHREDGFALPEGTSAPEACYRTEFLVDESEFVSCARFVGATPAIFAAMLLSESISSLHPEAEKPVVCNMAVDMRGTLGLEKIHRNCVASAYLSYGEKEKALGQTELAQHYRAMLAKQREPDAVRAGLNKQIGLFNQLDKMTTLAQKREMMSFFNGMINNTYVLSYLGRLQLNDFAEHVDSARFFSDTICGLTVNMLSAGGKMSIEILQGFPEKIYIQAFEKMLRGCHLTVDITDMAAVATGKDKSYLTASRQAERYYADLK